METITDPLLRLISFTVRIYTFIIIARAIISWVQPNPYNPIVQALHKLTEPVLAPVRKVLLRNMGNIGIDFSPFIVIIGLNIFVMMLHRIF